MPGEPPVMIAAFPSKFFVIVVLLYAQSRRTLKHMLIRHEPNVVARQASPHHVRLRQWVVVTKLKHTLLSWEECFTSMGVEMELRHLRYFVAVAEAGSLTVAAERLHTSQPSLSRQIRDLEDEVGAQLLTRGARGIELTPA